MIGAGLDHASQSLEQAEHSRCGLLGDMILHLFQKLGGIFVAMAGGYSQPIHTHFQILRYSLSKAVELVFPLIGTMAGTM